MKWFFALPSITPFSWQAGWNWEGPAFGIPTYQFFHNNRGNRPCMSLQGSFLGYWSMSKYAHRGVIHNSPAAWPLKVSKHSLQVVQFRSFLGIIAVFEENRPREKKNWVSSSICSKKWEWWVFQTFLHPMFCWGVQFEFKNLPTRCNIAYTVEMNQGPLKKKTVDPATNNTNTFSLDVS